ncbi:MAG TPA: Mur ligase family protein [Candidatus Saccharimonadales bacterium]|nr:Mur ligase family protein [Candidatus Saccharimonadales bacterium]
MPISFTIFVAKTLSVLSRGLGRGSGSALPGLIAERLDPGIGRKLARRLPHGSIIVTGTNGKTTTSRLLAGIMTDSGDRLVTNRAGSNLSRGVVSALIDHAGLSGRFKETAGLFEVDEAAMPAVARMLQPRAIIVLNLFRDQLDRYGELDTTANLVGQGIEATKAEVYLNADDPLVATLAKYAAGRVKFFGIDKVPIKKLEHDHSADSAHCPVDGRALKFSQNFFGHIGHYKCPNGDFARPRPDVSANHLKLGDSTTFRLENGESEAIKLNLPGIYNVYNALAAGALAVDHLGLEPASVARSIENVKAAFGRVEQLEWMGKKLNLLLVKNPTGFNQVIQTFMLKKKQQKVLFIINDNFADGRDVSWLWDVAFEELVGMKHHITTSGIRSADMALRLKYAEVKAELGDVGIRRALKHFCAQLDENEVGLVVPTYTAMLETRQIMAGSKLEEPV